MAWLLLHDNSDEDRVDRVAPDPPPRVAPEPVPASEAWVLLGGLSASLYQAGYLHEMLAAGQFPSTLVGAGFGAVNALLASPLSASAFIGGWERLRGRHFVMSAALEEAGGLPSRLIPQDALANAAKHAASFVVPSAEVRLVAGERFSTCTSTHGSRATDLLAPALRRTDVEPDTIAAAIAAAADAQVARILVWGADEWTASSPLVLKQLDEAGRKGTQVRFARHYAGPEPKLLEMLLPGAGAVERLFERGRAVAADDLERMGLRRKRESRLGE